MAHVTEEFEASTQKTKDADTQLHEQAKHAQIAFAPDVKALIGTIEDVKVLTGTIEVAAIDPLDQFEKLGQGQCETYVSECLANQSKPITDPTN